MLADVLLATITRLSQTGENLPTIGDCLKQGVAFEQRQILVDGYSYPSSLDAPSRSQLLHDDGVLRQAHELRRESKASTYLP